MTATLADDGQLVTQLGADPKSTADPIKPKGAGEIGDRMIIVPQEINENIFDDDVKSLVAGIARTRNVCVIVPSEKRSRYWSDISAQTLTAGNIFAGVEKLKSGAHIGVTVFVNRYDGVDLPDDACRLLVIDGLPEVQGLEDRVDATLLEGTDAFLLRQIQKLEQGMGRGVRSGEDRCAVLLLGARLTQRINQTNARAMFTPATLVQMDLGREVTRQIKGQPAKALQPILELCMDGDKQWWSAGRARLAHASDGQPARVDDAVVRQREAFDYQVSGRPDLAEKSLQTAVNSESDRLMRGFLKQQLAAATHPTNPAQAQEILLSALSDNRNVLKPLAGITHVRIAAPAGQAAASAEFMGKRFVDTNQLVLFANALAADLIWDEDRTDQFEAAIRDLGLLLGFGSQRPEKEYRDGGPDNLWAIGALNFLAIECKSGVKNDGRLISKDHCNQILGAKSWFMSNYDSSCSVIPIIIHPVNKFQVEASPSSDIRIIETDRLNLLRDRVRQFGAAVAQSGSLSNIVEIGAKLSQAKFTRQDFVSTFTRPYTAQA